MILKFQSTRSQDRDKTESLEELQLQLFQSTRSQDRDYDAMDCPECGCISIHSVARPRQEQPVNSLRHWHFNPLGRKTETAFMYGCLIPVVISIHSVARPRRKTPRILITWQWISIHSVARPRRYLGGRCRRISYFNPLGRKTETSPCICSACFSIYFNPLGRKTETSIVFTIFSFSTFQSTRSQDRDVLIALIRALGRIISIHSVARPRLYSASISAFSATFQSTRSQDRDVI